VRSRPLVNESALRLPERREELRARRRVYRRVTQIPREGSFLFPAVATRVLLLTYAAVSVGDEKPLACAHQRDVKEPALGPFALKQKPRKRVNAYGAMV